MLKAEYQHRGKVPQDVIEAVKLELPPLAAGQALVKVWPHRSTHPTCSP